MAKKNSSINKRNKTGWDEINYAIVNCDLDRAIHLVNEALGSQKVVAGGSKNVVDPVLGDPSPLHSKLVCRLLHLLNEENTDKILPPMIGLLKLGCDPKAKDEDGNTALHLMTRKETLAYDFPEFSEALLGFIDESERISFINTKNKFGSPAILCALADRYHGPTMIASLLESGADPYVGDPTGVYILHKLLLFFSDEWEYAWDDPIMHDSDGDDSDRDDAPVEDHVLPTVTKLLHVGCSPMVRDHKGRTALHLFVQNHLGRLHHEFIATMTSCVCEHQRFVNALDKLGKTALDYAINLSHWGKIRALILVGADPCAGKDPTGSSLIRLMMGRNPSRSLDSLLDVALELFGEIESTPTFLFLQKMAAKAGGRPRTGK